MESWFRNMDSPPMHFAVGMVCGGALWMLVVLIRPRWWVYTPIAMTLGGLWAEGPDLPLLFHYYPSLSPDWVRGNGWSEALHGKWANLFFFHGWIDTSGEGSMVRGWALTIALYGGWCAVFMVREWLRRRTG